jgi:hypothetical protein
MEWRDKRNMKVVGEQRLGATVSTTEHTWIGLQLNPSLHIERMATKPPEPWHSLKRDKILMPSDICLDVE